MNKISFQVGDQWLIKGFQAQAGNFRQRLLAMGLLPGSLLQVIRIAPLGDPIVIRVRGYDLGIRKAELTCLELEKSEVVVC